MHDDEAVQARARRATAALVSDPDQRPRLRSPSLYPRPAALVARPRRRNLRAHGRRRCRESRTTNHTPLPPPCLQDRGGRSAPCALMPSSATPAPTSPWSAQATPVIVMGPRMLGNRPPRPQRSLPLTRAAEPHPPRDTSPQRSPCRDVKRPYDSSVRMFGPAPLSDDVAASSVDPTVQRGNDTWSAPTLPVSCASASSICSPRSLPPRSTIPRYLAACQRSADRGGPSSSAAPQARSRPRPPARRIPQATGFLRLAQHHWLPLPHPASA